VVFGATGCVDAVRATRFMNMAIASGAVSMLLFHTKAGGVVMASGSVDEAVWLHIDARRMLSIDTLQACVDRGLTAYDQSDKSFSVSASGEDGTVMWSDRNVGMTTTRGPHHIVFKLGTQSKFLGDVWNTTHVNTRITDGTAGSFYPLDLYLVDSREAWDVQSNPFVDSSLMKHVVTLQMHAALGSGCKRKRPVEWADNADDSRQGAYARV